MRRDQLLRLVVAGRVVVGGGALLAPHATGRLFGIDPGSNPALPFVGRLFGVRAVLMAVLVSAADGEERDRQLRAGVAVDLVDAAAALLAGWRRQLRPSAAMAAFAAAATEVGLGMSLVTRAPAASLPIEGRCDRDAGTG
jgi:hypothetical protein